MDARARVNKRSEKKRNFFASRSKFSTNENNMMSSAYDADITFFYDGEHVETRSVCYQIIRVYNTAPTAGARGFFSGRTVRSLFETCSLTNTLFEKKTRRRTIVFK